MSTLRRPTLHAALLVAVILCAAGARIPGVFWGSNFPEGWYGHHIDEYLHLVHAETLIDPTAPPRWPPVQYTKGIAAHVAFPFIVTRLLEKKLYGPLPEPQKIIVFGRIVSVCYGTATVVVLYLLIAHLLKNRKVALLAAAMTALGGLHVSQSHFFLPDVAAQFWFLLALYFLIRSLDGQPSSSHFLNVAAFTFGLAFGIKMNFAGLPSLFLAAFVQRPKWLHLLYTGSFFLLGISLVNMWSLAPIHIHGIVTKRMWDPYSFDRLVGLVIYLVELPAIVSFPVLLLFVLGVFRFLRSGHSISLLGAKPIFLIVILPLIAYSGSLIFVMDHFPRHLLFFVPLIFGIAAWELSSVLEVLNRRRVSPAWVLLPFFLYLATFVYDGERVFWTDPRNKAALWLSANAAPGTSIWWQVHDGLKKYRHVGFPQGKPEILVMEMHYSNHWLSGVGFKNRYPTNEKEVFGSLSKADLESLQALFRGGSEYRKQVSYNEGYFMPEFVLEKFLIGNRCRNFVAEIVIFRQYP
jgi:4-amino-4-deoxy-L-arabinose transferase-like glycosyltransferase